MTKVLCELAYTPDTDIISQLLSEIVPGYMLPLAFNTVGTQIAYLAGLRL